MNSLKYYVRIFILIFLGGLFIEAGFKLISFGSILNFSFIRIILFTIVYSLGLALIYVNFKERVVKILILATLFCFSLYAILQVGFFTFMGNYLSLTAGEAAPRVFDFIIEFFKVLKWNYYLLFLPFILCLIFFKFKKNYLEYYYQPFRIKASIMLIVILLHVLSIFTLNITTHGQLTTNKELYKNPNLLNIALKEFGTNRFMLLDIKNIIMPSVADLDVDIDPEKPVVTDYSRKFDDTDWITMMENETNPTIKALHQYYLNQESTDKNEMTGYFKDKNLILIMVEAFDLAAISETLTPTLYRLTKESWYFDNYYAPEYSCATGESEYIGLTSTIPLNTSCAPFDFVNNDYSTSIFNLFNNSDYHSTSYHSWDDKFYPRTKLHASMGSLEFYERDELGVTVLPAWPSDLDFMEKALPKYIDEDPYFSFMITASMHFSYDTVIGTVAKYWNLVKDLPYSAKMKSYLAKSIDFDKSIEYLLATLEEKGELDDTVIVLFGDHHPLGGMPTSSLSEVTGINRSENFNLFLRPFIIYNSEIEPKVIHEVASTYDILPTLANLFDLDFDPRYYVGKDLFSNGEQIAIMPNGSWITDKAMYFSSRSEYELIDLTLDESYIIDTNKKVKNYINFSNQSLLQDYFKYRFK